MKMDTCKYCGTEVSYIGEKDHIALFHCGFCKMTFDEPNISQNRLRLNQTPEYERADYYLSTEDCLKCTTIELLFMLRECRKDWYQSKVTLENLANAEDIEEEIIEKTVKDYYPLYEELTKRKFVLENIIYERTGFIPTKLTNDFIQELLVQSDESAKIPMNVFYKKKRGKTNASTNSGGTGSNQE